MTPFSPLPTLGSVEEPLAPIALDSPQGRALLAECADADRAAFELLWPARAEGARSTDTSHVAGHNITHDKAHHSDVGST